ncbi:hypothetical protein Ahy_B01g053576 isoform B [Arachis hypogaea]|uniref:Uncharacterized protein n=1 Tax=Arachis hypogaea TaxID=3818 RepID=A0A445AS09_ARAHY|nr:hypothetical protein Ahy_B01g053576 isoform B [Arachis hypogaea]
MFWVRNQHEMLVLSVVRSRAPGTLFRCHSQVAGNQRGHKKREHGVEEENTRTHRRIASSATVSA